MAEQKNLWQRARILTAVRGFFMDQGYLEVETPYILPAPIPEAHIDYIETPGGVLHPSPEVYMKRLVAQGYSRIYQIARCFRDSERGDRHLAEFTLLEWYRTGDYMALMEECEAMVVSVAHRIGLGTQVPYQGGVIQLARPWERMTVREAFKRYAPMPMEEAIERDGFEEILVGFVEPRLGVPVPSFLYDYPAQMASLSRICAHDSDLCERFELYLGGLEIANGFSELVDAREQERRFNGELEARKRTGLPTHPMPRPFLRALEKMPETAGIALGLDRLIMVLCDCGHIGDVVSFTPEDG